MNIWLISHRLRGDTGRARRLHKTQAEHIHRRTICLPVKRRPKMSLTLQIPANLICSHADSHKEGVYEGDSAVPQMDGWMVRDVCWGHSCKGSAKTNKDFILASSCGGHCLWHEALADSNSVAPNVLRSHLCLEWRLDNIIHGTRGPSGFTALMWSELNFNVLRL